MSKAYLQSNNIFLLGDNIYTLPFFFQKLKGAYKYLYSVRKVKKVLEKLVTSNVYFIILNILKHMKNDEIRLNKPYLNTTTSKQVENTKAFEWTIIKELGKLTTVTSG